MSAATTMSMRKAEVEQETQTTVCPLTCGTVSMGHTLPATRLLPHDLQLAVFDMQLPNAVPQHSGKQCLDTRSYTCTLVPPLCHSNSS